MRVVWTGILLLAGMGLLPAEPDVWSRIHTLEKEGKTGESLLLVQQTLRNVENSQGIDSMEMVPLLQKASQFHIRRSDFEEGKKCLERVLEICRKKEGENSIAAATAWYELGWFQQSRAEYARAQVSLEKALALREKHFGRRHESVAECLNGIGVVLENQGKFDLSEKAYLEALPLRQELLGKEHNATLTTENNLATLYWSRGDYARAEPYFVEVLKIRRRTQGPGALATVTSMNNLALLYRSMGDHERAERLFLSVLRLREQNLGSLHAFTLTTLHQLGLLYADRRMYSKAEPLLLRAAEGRKKTAGLDHPDTARSFFHLAWFYDRSGRFEKAEPLHMQALDIRRKILGEEHPETAGSEAFLARHYHLQGKHDRAEPVYRKALELQTRILGRDHPDTLKTLEALACLEMDLGRRDAALIHVREAMGVRERMLQELFTFTSEQQRMDFQKTLSLYDLPASLGSADDIAKVVFRTKGLVLDSVVEDRNKAQKLADPALTVLLQRLQVVSRELLLGDMKKSPANLDEPYDQEIRRDELQRQQAELQSTFVRRVSAQSKARRALQTELSEVKKVLKKNSILLEWVRYNAYEKNLVSHPSYGVLMVFPDQEPVWIPLGRAESIDLLVRRYQKVMRRRVSDDAMASILRDLSDRIWKPVGEKLTSDTRNLILCPDGPLNFVSFSTLLDSQSRFLCETWNFSYVSSGRDLLRSTGAVPVEKTVMVFANPDYGYTPFSSKAEGSSPAETDATLSALRDFDFIRLKPLLGSQEEADWLGRHALGLKLQVKRYTGVEATETALNALRSPMILHLATHGLFLGEEQGNPGEPIREGSHPKRATGVNLKDPMQRSMLMLAGAQRTLEAWQNGVIPDTSRDGVVTAAEVGALNLEGTWLVVLSACETGQGEALAGEGVLGLRRGFVMAGAQNLMMTLWPVADRETVPLMGSFYEKAFATQDPALALSEVQRERLLELRKKQGLSQAVRLAGPFILSR